MIKPDWTAKTYKDLRFFKIDGDNNSTVSKTWLLALLVCKKKMWSYSIETKENGKNQAKVL